MKSTSLQNSLGKISLYLSYVNILELKQDISYFFLIPVMKYLAKEKIT